MTVASLLKLSAPPEKKTNMMRDSKQHPMWTALMPGMASLAFGAAGTKMQAPLTGANWPFCRMGSFWLSRCHENLILLVGFCLFCEAFHIRLWWWSQLCSIPASGFAIGRLNVGWVVGLRNHELVGRRAEWYSLIELSSIMSGASEETCFLCSKDLTWWTMCRICSGPKEGLQILANGKAFVARPA